VTLVEPLKIVALFVAGEGHWLTGTGMILGAYAVSLLVVERLFGVVKPKLMTLGWFAKLWTRLVTLRNKVIPWSSVPVESSKTGWFHLFQKGPRSLPPETIGIMKDAMDAAVASLPDPISLKFLGANAVIVAGPKMR
jgi:hypothetical protein